MSEVRRLGVDLRVNHDLLLDPDSGRTAEPTLVTTPATSWPSTNGVWYGLIPGIRIVVFAAVNSRRGRFPVVVGLGGAHLPATARGRRPRRFISVHALGLAGVLASAAGVGFVSFLVIYAVANGMGEGTAGLLLGGVSLIATLSRIGVGLFADRAGQEPLGPVAAMLALSVTGYLLLIAGEPAVIALAALLAGALGWAWPGGLNLAVVQRSPDAPAPVGALMTGLFTGAVAGPLLVGLLAEQDLFEAARAMCAAFVLLAALTLVATRRVGGAAAMSGPAVSLPD